MNKEELELKVLKSDLDDIVKLEVIRCIELSKSNNCISPYNGLEKYNDLENGDDNKDFSSNKLDIRYKK